MILIMEEIQMLMQIEVMIAMEKVYMLANMVVMYVALVEMVEDEEESCAVMEMKVVMTQEMRQAIHNMMNMIEVIKEKVQILKKFDKIM